MATGAQGASVKVTKKAPGHKSLEIAEQINFCREQLHCVFYGLPDTRDARRAVGYAGAYRRRSY